MLCDAAPNLSFWALVEGNVPVLPMHSTNVTFNHSKYLWEIEGEEAGKENFFRLSIDTTSSCRQTRAIRLRYSPPACIANGTILGEVLFLSLGG